mgnify:CR=1 FL=1
MVAAGSGSRLGAAVPKAFVTVAGRPLLRHSAQALIDGGVDRVVIVAPSSHLAAAAVVLQGLTAPWNVVAGGARRQDSVAEGLASLGDLPDDAIVLVHDAARPLVPPAVVRAAVDAVRDGAVAVIPAVPVVDSLRQVRDGGSVSVDRSRFRAVQTPQAFRKAELVEAHAFVAAQGLEVTDDAAACEARGHTVALVPGHPDALKITEPLDLVLAEAIVRGRA